MNKKGKTIELTVNDDKTLSGFYALGFSAEEVLGCLYQAIKVVCQSQGVDPAVQLMYLMIATEEVKHDEDD